MVDCSTQWIQRYRSLCQQKRGENEVQLTLECRPKAMNEQVNNVKLQMVDMMVRQIGMLENKLCSECDIEQATIGDVEGFD